MALARCRQRPEPVHPVRDSYQLGVGVFNINTTPVSSYSDEDMFYVETLLKALTITSCSRSHLFRSCPCCPVC